MNILKLIPLLILISLLINQIAKDIKNTPKNHPHQLAIIKLIQK